MNSCLASPRLPWLRRWPIRVCFVAVCCISGVPGVDGQSWQTSNGNTYLPSGKLTIANGTGATAPQDPRHTVEVDGGLAVRGVGNRLAIESVAPGYYWNFNTDSNGNFKLNCDCALLPFFSISGGSGTTVWNSNLWLTNNNRYNVPLTLVGVQGQTPDLFDILSSPGTAPLFVVNSAGNVGIGTSNPQHALQVAGTIGAKEVIVSSTGADYVFSPEYRLTPLAEVSDYIEANHHLPGIPSADDVSATGMNVGDMQSKLLAKIEELTLHLIQADQRMNRLEQENRELRRIIMERK